MPEESTKIAKKLDVPPRKIRKIFAKKGIEPRKYNSRDRKIAKMYYSQRMSKIDIARKLGISYNTVLRTFDKYGWKSIPRRTRANPEEARKLYEKGWTQTEIAEKLGVSRHTVGNYLRELGVETRRRGFKSDTERQQAKQEKSRKQTEKVKALRDKLFGTNCRICGIGRSKRKIAIHKKDCEEHDEKQLWRLGFLRKVDPNDWAALCVMCHRGTHWANDEMGASFDVLEKMSKQENQSKEDTDNSQKESKKDSSPKSKTNKSNLTNMTVEEIRKELFGDECFYCGELPSDKRLVIHKKDGEYHDDNDLWVKDTLMNLNREEWEALCAKHHRYTHWAMKWLHLSWEDIVSAVKK